VNLKPLFLTLDEVVAIHSDQIQRYGGSAGVRDWNLLRSALAMPAASFGGQYLQADLCEMAAAYLFHLVKNHAFVDGNKRVGAVAADIFLAFNGLHLIADQDDYTDLVIAVASGKTSKSAVAEFYRKNAKTA
jgi:death-on-curing protein